MSTPITFAAMNKDIFSIDPSGTYVIELYDRPVSTLIPMAISGPIFTDLFYNNAGKFRINTQNDPTILDTYLEPMNNKWFNATSGTLNIIELILSQWETELGYTRDLWSTESTIRIMRQLIPIQLVSESIVTPNTALDFSELIYLLNLGDGGSRTNTFIVGDLLTLSIVIDNGNTSTNLIEIRLNFKIA